MFKKLTITLTTMLAMSTFLAACGNDNNAGSNELNEEEENLSEGNVETVHVMTTLYPLEYFAERIGEDFVEVTNMVPVGADAHTFEPTANQMIEVAESDLFIFNGADFEGFAGSVKDAVADHDVTVLEAVEGISLLEDTHDHNDDNNDNDHGHNDDNNHNDNDHGHNDDNNHNDNDHGHNDDNNHNDNDHGHNDDNNHNDNDHGHNDDNNHNDNDHGHNDDNNHNDNDHGHNDDNNHNDNDHGHNDDNNHNDNDHGHNDDNNHNDNDHGHNDNDGHDHAHGDEDPHVWLDPVLSIEYAENIKNALIDVRPEGEEEFTANFEELKADLESLHEDFQAMADEKVKDTIIVSHAGYGYWEDRYHIEQIGIAGLSPTNEPSIQQIQDVISHMEDNDINYVMFEQNIPTNIAETVREEVGAEELWLHNLEVLTEEDIENNEDYFSLMRQNIETLETALQ
ncbi:metal ABC transporter solute-binding protein, Zn/Mn family [Salipaludibacillus daqingensis]|uniref:metal ABC transporter solute-binding protein, Zn/Mn family n=1 Tax=Salipaludibacillus daqingensis TaxID=3041001 RepID=UPI002473CDEB|nr:zinc ABC transporter substrate-binding protein [Salipaludibacillus daqingensis]